MSLGKTYLAKALVTAASRNDFSARFPARIHLPTTSKLLKNDDLARLAFPDDIHSADVLVLNDFLITPIEPATANQLLDTLAERESHGSTIVTSQFTPDQWCKSIPDAIIAGSNLNRLVAGADIITLEGPNMRLNR